MRAICHYTLAALLLTIYGGQVCPFIDRLTLTNLAAIVFGWMFFFFALRLAIQHRFINHAPALSKASRQFLLEFFTFAAAGLSMAIFNMLVYGFPFGSGLKLLVACLTLGIFAAADLALARDHQVALRMDSKDLSCPIRPRFISLTHKLAIIAMALAAGTALILLLVILHDLRWIRMLPAETNLTVAARGIMLEFIFVLAVLLTLTANLVTSLTRNLRLYFGRQTKVLEEVAQGDLSGFVPVTTCDEFGVIANFTNDMIQGLRQRTKELQLTQDVTIISLASLAETRDNETGQHILRTQAYVRALAAQLTNNPDYRPLLDTKTIDLLYKSAPLHDIGKVGIPDRILLKPGKLDKAEFAIMKKHAQYGRDALRTASQQLGDNSFLRLAQEIAYTHHEKWDGSGYPQGLKGHDIPLSGRLMALADVYDALISKRIYKEAFSHEKAKTIILEGSGRHFDPAVVAAFRSTEEAFKGIAQAHKDNNS